MDPSDPTVTSTAADIESEFSGRWGVWRSDTGQWWAARRRPLAADELAAECVPYLQASSPDELRDRIRNDESLTSREVTG